MLILAVPTMTLGLILDASIFDGAITKILLRASRDEGFREKAWQTIKEGRGDDKVVEFWREKTKPYVAECGLGEEVLGCTEEILDRGFDSYEVRPMILGNVETNNLILIAKYSNNVKPVKTILTPNNQLNLATTQNEKGQLFTIPSSIVDYRTDGSKFVLFSSYRDGEKIITFGEDMLDYGSGAVVLNLDGSIKVVDRLNIQDYEVGSNCDAVQSYALAVNSDNLEDDMRSLNRISYGMAGTGAIGRINSSFIVTFSNKLGKEETNIITCYQHYDSANHAVDLGEEWYQGFSIQQGVGICEQLMLERGYDKYNLVAPDPHYMHSNMQGPFVFKGKDLKNSRMRQFGYDVDADIEEALNMSGFLCLTF